MKTYTQSLIPSYPVQRGLISSSRRFRRPNNVDLLCTQAKRVLQIQKNRESRRPSPPATPVQQKQQPAAQQSREKTRFSVRLPRSLPRPAIKPISLTHLADWHPELTNVPAEYIRSSLPAFGTHLFATLTRVKKTNASAAPMSTLPKELQIYIQGPASALPTHMFAVHGPIKSTSPAAKNKVILLPAHELVFAANCANLPPLSKLSYEPATSSSSSPDGITATVPLVPLCLPAPELFPMLQHYLYTKQPQPLLARLLPASLDRTSDLELIRQAAVVHNFWKNACALGVVDTQLYDLIDETWESIATALEHLTL